MRTTLKTMAIQAVTRLASEHAPANWPTIDRIERRFKIIGTADHVMARQAEAQAQYVKDFIEKHTTWEDRLWLH